MAMKDNDKTKKEAAVAILLLRLSKRNKAIQGDLYAAVDQIDIELTNLKRKANLEGWTHDELLLASDVQINRLKRYTKDTFSGLAQTAFVAYGALSYIDGMTQPMAWQTQSNNVCPDCDSLHGEVRTYEEWLSTTMPGSGSTVCGGRCQCVLVPVEEATKNPITIERENGKAVSVYERSDKPVPQ